MEDYKLRECWVVLEDCGSILPGARESTWVSAVDEDETSLVASDRKYTAGSSTLAETPEDEQILQNHPTSVCNAGMVNNIKASSQDRPNVFKLKKPHSLWKSAHKKRGLSGQQSAHSSANHAKHHLLQKYGTSLLRKPSFSIETTNVKLSSPSQSSNFLDECSDQGENSSSGTTIKTVGEDSVTLLEQNAAFVSQSSVIHNADLLTVQNGNNAEKSKLLVERNDTFCGPSVFGGFGEKGLCEKMKPQKTTPADTGKTLPESLSEKIERLRKNFSFQVSHVDSCLEIAGIVSKPQGTLSFHNHSNEVVDKESSGMVDSLEKAVCDMETVTMCKEVEPDEVIVLEGTCDSTSASSMIEAQGLCSAPNGSKVQSDVIVGDNNQLFTNPSYPMPAVGMAVDVRLGSPLLALQARCVLACLDDCRGALTPQFAEFCSSVVKTPSTSPAQTVMMPIKDKRILQFMQIKWKSRSAVKKCTLSSLPRQKRDISRNKSIVCNVLHESSAIATSFQSKSSSESSQQQSSKVASFQRNYLGKNPHHKQNMKSQVSCKRRVIRHQKGSLIRSKPRLYPPITSEPVDDDNTQIDENFECSAGVYNKRVKFTLLAADKEKSASTDITMSIQPIEGSDDLTFANSSVNMKRASNEKTIIQDGRVPELMSQPPYDPDDTRGFVSSDDIAEEPKEIAQRRASHLMHELRRLNVALFDVTNFQEPVVCKSPDICRLGCVCSSLCSKVMRDNCGLERCMFGCTCPKFQPSQRENSGQNFTWMGNKAKANLAKEERHFKQTVVRSGKDNLVLVEGKRKREIKLPGRYREDFVSDVDHRPPVSKKTTKSMLQGSSSKEHCQKKSQNKLSDSQTSGKSQPEELNSPPRSSLAISERLKEWGYDEDPGTSARTVTYVCRSRENRQESQKKLLSESSCEKFETVNGIKIKSTESLNREDWENSDSNIVSVSCAALFNLKFVSANENKVVLLSWDALRNDMVRNKVFLWLKSTKSKPKVFLTKDYVKPCENCVEFQSLSLSSEECKDLPFHLRTLRLEYPVSDAEEKCVWIAKHRKSHWMIVGYMQPGQQKHQTLGSREVDVLSPFDEGNQHRWWVMDVHQNFDLLYFMDFKKAVSKQQITTLLKLSNEYAGGENKIHRILLNRRRPKIDPRPTPFPDFGAYSLSNRPSEVLIGPYNSSREPRFQVFTQKVAQNGKTEYEKIPLFHCSRGECVKVNSKGVLSLHLEDPPVNCVKGSWYQSMGSQISELQNVTKQAGNQGNNRGQYTRPELIDLTPSEALEEGSSSSDMDCSVEDGSGSEDESSKTSSKLQNHSKDVSENNGMIFDEKCQTDSKVSLPCQVSLESESPKHAGSGQPTLLSLLKKCNSHSKSERSLKDQPESSKADKEQTNADQVLDMDDEDPEEAQDLRVVYLVPSVRQIGYLTVTHLPNGALSVPHFTQPGLLKFFHNDQELMNDINMLIHNKLSCLSRKCSVFLRPNDFCKCVTWQSVTEKPDHIKLQPFSPVIFDGFTMLTKYGVLDLRTVDEHIIRKLGEDWIDWLKNDEVRVKLSQWVQGERQKITENQEGLVQVLTSSKRSDLSLQQVLVMATDEIARLKAQDQLLDYECETQKMMKETLIYSLCRKLNGIPGAIVPQFLEQLSLDVLWEVLECMDYRSTHTLAKVTPISPLHASDREPPLNHCKNPQILQKKKLASQVILEHYKHQQQQQMKQKLMCEGLLSNQEQSNIHGPSKDNFSSLFPQGKGKEGIVCRVSPFARLNICVEEGGIKYGSLTSPPLLFNNDMPTSPGKTPNILRKNKNFSSDPDLPMQTVSHVGNQHQKGNRRKQLFSCSPDNNEEPTFQEDPELLNSEDELEAQEPTLSSKTNAFSACESVAEKAVMYQANSSLSNSPIFTQMDPISSLRISSVVSGASALHNTASDSSLQGHSALVSSERDSMSVELPSSLPMASVLMPVDDQSEPSSSLQISSVYSTKISSTLLSSTQVSSATFASTTNVDPISSLRISSVTSAAMAPVSSSNPNMIPHAQYFNQENSSTFVTQKPLFLTNTDPVRVSKDSTSSKIVLTPSLAFKTTRHLVKSNTAHDAHLVKAQQHTTFSNTAFAMGTKPYYVVSKQGGKLLSVEVPAKQSPPPPVPNMPQGKVVKIMQKNGKSYSLTVPLSSLKILAPSTLNKIPESSMLASEVGATKSGGPVTVVSAAVNTLSDTSVCKIAPSSASTKEPPSER